MIHTLSYWLAYIGYRELIKLLIVGEVDRENSA